MIYIFVTNKLHFLLKTKCFKMLQKSIHCFMEFNYFYSFIFCNSKLTLLNVINNLVCFENYKKKTKTHKY